MAEAVVGGMLSLTSGVGDAEGVAGGIVGCCGRARRRPITLGFGHEVPPGIERVDRRDACGAHEGLRRRSRTDRAADGHRWLSPELNGLETAGDGVIGLRERWCSRPRLRQQVVA